MRIGNWDIVKTIGTGRWSKISLCKPHGCQSNNADYIIKYVDADSVNIEFAQNMLFRELACSKLVVHSSIVSFLDGDPQNSTPYLVSARHPGETLQKINSQLGLLVELGQKLTCFRQICDGLRAFHDLGIRHGDLSPTNILIDLETTQTLLVDLGLSEKVNPFRRESECIAGTLGYVAPECIQPDLPVNLSADIFSLGMVMQEFLDNRPNTLLHASFYSPIRQALARLLISMKAPNPLKRPTISEVAQTVSLLEISCLEVDYRAAS